MSHSYKDYHMITTTPRQREWTIYLLYNRRKRGKYQCFSLMVIAIITSSGFVSPQCNFSGIILQASNGHFSAIQWKTSAGVDFGETIATPEAIADQWSTITGV